jgi:hypothetical protein
MKIVLIAWCVVHGVGGQPVPTAATNVEFESMKACENAGKVLEKEDNYVTWEYVCVPKDVE